MHLGEVLRAVPRDLAHAPVRIDVEPLLIRNKDSVVRVVGQGVEALFALLERFHALPLRNVPKDPEDNLLVSPVNDVRADLDGDPGAVGLLDPDVSLDRASVFDVLLEYAPVAGRFFRWVKIGLVHPDDLAGRLPQELARFAVGCDDHARFGVGHEDGVVGGFEERMASKRLIPDLALGLIPVGHVPLDHPDTRQEKAEIEGRHEAEDREHPVPERPGRGFVGRDHGVGSFREEGNVAQNDMERGHGARVPGRPFGDEEKGGAEGAPVLPDSGDLVLDRERGWRQPHVEMHPSVL